MQPKPHEDANQRNNPPQPGKGMPRREAKGREPYPDQGDQWAVLRHEMEGEEKREMLARGSRQSDLDQRDTEEDAVTSQTPSDYYDDAPNQVDIVVAGIGGAGMNAVNRMISTRVRGVRFVAMNTDAQVLDISQAGARICLGQRYTKGLGSGGNANVGARAAAESAEEIQAALGNADLVFIAAGMGGGTGTGGAPVVASLAKKLGALTIGIVTLPFTFEGYRRKKVAGEGLASLGSEVDALITIPNDRLLDVTGRDRSLADAFKIADDVLRQGVQGIAEVINVPGLVNVDFADVRSVLREAGSALMSIGQGQGRNRAQQAAEAAIAGGFLNVAIRGAQRVLFNISGGEDMTLFEVNEVAELIGNAVDTAADITFGAVIDPTLDDKIRVTLIAAGMQEMRTARIPAVHQEQPLPSRASNASFAPGRIPPIQPSPPATNIPTSPRQPNNYAGERYGDSHFPAISHTPVPPDVEPMRPATSPARPPAPQGRPQRSLDDLRGLRSMGRRQEMLRSQRDARESGDYEDEGIDMPPFMKRYQ
ncbi:MAG TPA: cell division protein FtsZ [Ktedonobacteraceae bacterium]|nr:cell division protein FtsZ [Ktedonobacteraceae bacterium]